MTLRTLTISRQLIVGMSFLMLLLLLLGGLAWEQVHKLWSTTHLLYNHPLQVRIALEEVRADVLTIHRGMKDVVIVHDSQTSERIVQEMERAETDAHRMFSILHERYLGPREDVSNAEAQFVTWNAIRRETIQLARAGEYQRALQRTMPDGVGGKQAEKIYSALDRISDFAHTKARTFYREAGELRENLLQRLATVVALMCLVFVVIALVLIRNIRGPIKNLSDAADRFRDGDYSARSMVTSGNELGQLSRTFNRLAETIQHDVWVKDGISQVQLAGLDADTPQQYCAQVIAALIRRTDALFVAVYGLRDANARLERIESAGLAPDLPGTIPLTHFEGLMGSTLLTGETRVLRSIPADTVFVAPLLAADVLPRSIAAVPLSAGEKVVAVLVLGTVHEMDHETLRLCEGVRYVIGARIATLRTSERLRVVAEKLEMQNRELETQSRELGQQTEELSEQNIILAMQKSQLNEANRLKSTFLSNMSHELRTPLNSVIALSGVLERRLKGSIGEEEYGYLDIIERNGRHLLSLINNILDLARIEAGREEVTITGFSVTELIEDVIVLMRPQAELKNLLLESTYAAEVPIIHSDAAKCRQILINLVGNAVKFTDAGVVRVHARIDDASLRIDVSDTGPGISPEYAGRIFEEFQQVDDGTARRHEGTGLGLAIARRYAELLGGSISLESTPGEGATFTVLLPLREEKGVHVAAPPRRSNARTSPPRGEGKRMLVVEDDEGVRTQLRDILSRNGYEVLTANDGHEAMMRVESVPDGIILDLMMPGVDGFEVLRQLRTHPRGQGVPVLILTAKHVTKEELAFLRGNNIHELIRKGDISGSELLQLLADMLHLEDHGVVKEVNPDAAASFQQLQHRPRILVVEDNPDNLSTVVALLGEHCELFCATDGPQAVEIAEREQPELALLDISLPGMDGFQVLERLRSSEALQTLPVVALTARALTEDRNEILARGFDAYLAKPVDATQLETTIVSMLHGK